MIAMVGDEVITLDKAYRMTVDGLRKLGWKDLELDSRKRGVNVSCEGSKETWELLLNFSKKGTYEVYSRSSWKVQNEALDIVRKLVKKMNLGNPEHDFRMNENGSFEVKTSAIIAEKKRFMEGIEQSIITNTNAYESYAGMLRRFVNIKPEYLENETEDFKLLMDSKISSLKNQ